MKNLTEFIEKRKGFWLAHLLSYKREYVLKLVAEETAKATVEAINMKCVCKYPEDCVCQKKEFNNRSKEWLKK